MDGKRGLAEAEIIPRTVASVWLMLTCSCRTCRCGGCEEYQKSFYHFSDVAILDSIGRDA